MEGERDRSALVGVLGSLVGVEAFFRVSAFLPSHKLLFISGLDDAAPSTTICFNES